MSFLHATWLVLFLETVGDCYAGRSLMLSQTFCTPKKRQSADDPGRVLKVAPSTRLATCLSSALGRTVWHTLHLHAVLTAELWTYMIYMQSWWNTPRACASGFALMHCYQIMFCNAKKFQEADWLCVLNCVELTISAAARLGCVQFSTVI